MSNEYKEYTIDRYNELIDVVNNIEDILLNELIKIKIQVKSGTCDFITERAIAQGKLKIINKVLRQLNPEDADEISKTIGSEVMEITI